MEGSILNLEDSSFKFFIILHQNSPSVHFGATSLITLGCLATEISMLFSHSVNSDQIIWPAWASLLPPKDLDWSMNSRIVVRIILDFFFLPTSLHLLEQHNHLPKFSLQKTHSIPAFHTSSLRLAFETTFSIMIWLQFAHVPLTRSDWGSPDVAWPGQHEWSHSFS